MSKRFRVSTATIAKLDELGIRPAAVFRRAGLPGHAARPAPRSTSPPRSSFALWRAIAERERPTRRSACASAARTASSATTPSPSPRSTRLRWVKRSTRWRATSGSPARRSVVVRRSAKECHIQFLWTMAEEPEAGRALTDLCFAWVLSIARRGTGGTRCRRCEWNSRDGPPIEPDRAQEPLRLPRAVRRAGRTRSCSAPRISTVRLSPATPSCWP